MIDRFIKFFHHSGNRFQGQEPDEQVLLLLRRHRFTILLPLSFITLLALLPVIMWIFMPPDFELDFGQFSSLFYLILTLWYLFLWLVAFYFLTLYSLNTVIVTDRRIIENEQHAFFSRKVSELHNHRVQDVSAHTHGFVETLVGYGDITVQTAASEREFVFHKIGDPERVKDRIMRAVAMHHDKTEHN